MPAATIGDSFDSFFDAVDEFFSNLASVRPLPLLLALAFFTAYLTLRARASFNILRAAYPTERIPFREIWGAYFAGYGFNAVIPARGGDVVRLFLAKTSVPHSSYPAVAATFVVELGFDIAMGSLILIFAFTQGVFPKPPDFAKLNAFDLSYLAQHPRFTLFLLTVLAVGGMIAFALLSVRVKAFWERVRQGLTILQDRRRYFREVFAVQFGGWCFRFAAFWMLLEAFNVGGSVENVLLVLGRERGLGGGAVHAPGRRRAAGAAGEGVRRHRGGIGRGLLLGRPADRDRRAHLRAGLHRARVHLPGAQLQGGHRAGPRGPRGRAGPRGSRGAGPRGRVELGPEALARLAHEDHCLGEHQAHRLEQVARLLLGVALEVHAGEAGDGHLDGELDRVVSPRHLLRSLHLLGELLHAPAQLIRVAEEAAEGVF